MAAPETRLHVDVHPNAASNAIYGFKEGVLHVRLTAPPVDGKANKALIAFLSGLLGVSKSSIDIRKGHARRQKLLEISGLSYEEVIKRLSPLL